MLDEARAVGAEFNRIAGENCLYFETGQGSALSAGANFGADQVTMEARNYGLARHYDPFIVNTVVGFIGPEYLYNDRQIIRAGLEDHFMGKLSGISMGCDCCYTNHADADQNLNENLMILLATAGCNYIMGMPLVMTSCSTTRPPHSTIPPLCVSYSTCARHRSLNAGWKAWALWQTVA